MSRSDGVTRNDRSCLQAVVPAMLSACLLYTQQRTWQAPPANVALTQSGHGAR